MCNLKEDFHCIAVRRTKLGARHDKITWEDHKGYQNTRGSEQSI